MAYNDIRQVIITIPRFLKIAYNQVDISIALDMYERFYAPIENYDIGLGEKEPSLSDMLDSVKYIMSNFEKYLHNEMYATFHYLCDLLFYRLVYLINDQTVIDDVPTGKYFDVLEQIENKFIGIYEFTGVDITFDDIAIM
jgi:hypothetical protein